MIVFVFKRTCTLLGYVQHLTAVNIGPSVKQHSLNIGTSMTKKYYQNLYPLILFVLYNIRSFVISCVLKCVNSIRDPNLANTVNAMTVFAFVIGSVFAVNAS